MFDTEDVIEIRNLYKSFKIAYDKPQTLKERLLFLGRNKVERRQILENINLNIKKGETVALIGTNGSGKSTLLKLMTKILYPNQGTLETKGKLTSLLELGAGFHPDFTGRENIYFNASIFGLTKKEIDARVNDIIAFSELEEFIDNPVRTYSSGMYMRLAFSIAINVDAEILLIDEILAVGDQHFQDKCFDKLLELKTSDKTIVIVSHDLNSIRNLCDRAIWIYKGMVRGDGAPDYVIQEYLNQVNLDHKEKRKKHTGQIVAKKGNYRGLIYIDNPIAFCEISHSSESFKLNGWELSDCHDSVIKVYIDNNEIQGVVRTDRPDVFIVYEGMYGGDETNDQAGWEIVIKPLDFAIGLHQIKVVSLAPDGMLIYQKESSFNIKEM
ncbi:MAG: ABC transporter ATP-binding protein [Erysipelotrichaceae bacterium]|nr:ABC transporter ATP-binding protein [Erysipelotrichaceae bacterium]